MAEPFIGEIRMFAGNFAPRDWAFCNGQIISITDNQALFSLLGTTYGGNGRTDFGLPDLRSRVPLHFGNSQGPGLSPHQLGQLGGHEQVPVTQVPQHTHQATFTPTGGGGSAISVDVEVAVANANGSVSDPTDNIIAAVPTGLGSANAYAAPSAATGKLGGVTATASGGGITGGSVTVDPAGTSVNVPVSQPYLAINFIIALQGLYPQRQ